MPKVRHMPKPRKCPRIYDVASEDPIFREYSIVFAMNLRSLRIGHWLSQVQLAERLGLSQTMIAYMETGRGNPSLKNLIKVAHYFELDIHDFLPARGLFVPTKKD